jgi:uncharacterized membrane protein YheB (UPF0754 family)
MAGFITSLSQDRDSASRTGLNNMLTELQESGLPVQLLERIYPVAAVKLEEFLRRRDVRATLIKYGNVLLSDVLENLSTFQRLMLTMGNYNVQLQESMPEIIDSFTARLMELLKSDTIRAQIISVIAGMLTPETLAQVLEKSGTLASRAEYFADLISKKVLSTAASAVPAVLKRLDIRKIVTDKIDSLLWSRWKGWSLGL